jgi:predicted peroxiredoxin
VHGECAAGGDREEDTDQQHEIGRFHSANVQQDGVMSVARALVVKCTSGQDAPERCSQASTVAATALAAGVEVSLWLTGEAVWLALPGRAEAFELPHSAPLAQLRDALLAGASITVCTQCAARRELTPDRFVAGVRVAGSASFVDEELRDGVQALVY